MKYLKTYEQNIEPQVGDYVICEDHLYIRRSGRSIEFLDFLLNNVGKIIGKNDDEYNFSSQYKYVIEYENIPQNIESCFDENRKNLNKRNVRAMKNSEILFFSPNKKDAETYIEANKYNL